MEKNNGEKTGYKTIDEYIRHFPMAVQELLQQVRQTIKAAAPDATEAISYQMPTFKLNGNLVHFAGYKNHIGFYPAPVAIKEFQQELAVYKNAKGSVQFPLNRPLPLDQIRRMVIFRAEKNKMKPGKKKP